MNEEPLPLKKASANDHLANERTFLAWVRTSIGVMGFGFVVVKFSLFIRQISAALGRENQVYSTGYSPIIGILLIGLGSLTLLLGYLRYQTTKRQLDQGQYYHSALAMQVITGLLFIASMLLLWYVIQTT
ncbi:YidH family protein [Siphonobacter sp.]|uniref:YidH family protein n=1 Tax=Siphonobacter sp. TaxID=1869184 RepID=UPI003B3B01CB